MKSYFKYIAVLAIILFLAVPYSVVSAEEIADGKYTADYLVLRAENDSASMANDYWEKPAIISIENGKAKVQLVLNNSEWITEYKYPSNGGHEDVTVISTDDVENKRTIEFSVDDITKPIVSKIHVTVAEIDYDHGYTIRLVFDLDSFIAVKEKAKPSPVPVPTEKPKVTPRTTPPSTKEPTSSEASQTVATATTAPVALAKPLSSEEPVETSDTPKASTDNSSPTPTSSAVSSPSPDIEETAQPSDSPAPTATPLTEETASPSPSPSPSPELDKPSNDGQNAAVNSELQAGESNHSESNNWPWFLLGGGIFTAAAGGGIYLKKRNKK